MTRPTHGYARWSNFWRNFILGPGMLRQGRCLFPYSAPYSPGPRPAFPEVAGVSLFPMFFCFFNALVAGARFVV